jgi:hypothetical protein
MMNDDNTFEEVQVMTAESRAITATDLVAGGATLQRQATKYTTAVAVQKPRKLKDVEMRVKAEVELDPEGAFYAWDVNSREGKKHVEGPTIGLCMSIARNFGNCAVDLNIEELPTHYMFTPVFLDLETGFTFVRAYRQRKGQNIGMRDRDRAEDITFQIGQSKAIRNVIKGGVPKAIIDNAIIYAKRIAASNLTPEQIEQKKTDMIAAFNNDFGVSIERLGEYMGDPDPSKWSIEKVIDLRSVYRSLKSGDLSVHEVFPEIEKPKKTEPPKEEAKPEPTPEPKAEAKTEPKPKQKKVEDDGLFPSPFGEGK